MTAAADLTEITDRSLLIVEDDKAFLDRLARAMETRGFAVSTCDNVSDGLHHIGQTPPAFAVVDLRLGDGNGLDVVSALKRQRPDARAIVLTGYGNIATAVTAVKLGAVDYLAKPVDADQVAQALLGHAGAQADGVDNLPDAPPPLKRLEWEHIQRVLAECEGNISEAARRLGLHRRTLQRKLAKRPVRETPNR